MELASRIGLTISTYDGGSPAGLIFGMRIYAGTKNPYNVFFPKTDENGHSSLEHDEVVGQFKDHWEEGLMDFNGTLDAAPQTVTLFLFNPSNLRVNPHIAAAWPLLKYEKTVWRSRQEKTEYFLSCENNNYDFPETTFEMPLDGHLSLRVNRLEA